jgi:hypothetical protein
MEGKNRYRELENNWMIDIKSLKALEIVPGSLLYLKPDINVENLVLRLYENESEAEQMLVLIKRYPAWLSRKLNYAQEMKVQKSQALRIKE